MERRKGLATGQGGLVQQRVVGVLLAVLGVDQKRRSDPPPSTQKGAFSDSSSSGTSKRARVNIDIPVVPSSPSAAAATVRGTRGARGGPAITIDPSSSETDSVVKMEAHVGISCKTEPSEAQGNVESGFRVREGALLAVLGHELTKPSTVPCRLKWTP